MLKILNKTRKVSGKMSVPKQIMTTFFALLFGGGMGIVAKFLDLNRLPSFLDWLDLSNFLGRTAPWIFYCRVPCRIQQITLKSRN